MWSQQLHISEGSIMNNYSTSGEITSPSPISNSTSFGYMMSPEQTVPQFENNTFFGGLNNNNKQTHLKILEQPIDQFRFRYKSEMSGTHGCLIGRTSKKSFPTVELKNYPGEAIVACTLVQIDQTHSAHPHRLVIWKHNEEMDDPHIFNINRKNGHTATFKGMSILYTSKKMIVEELIRKHKINFSHINYKENDLKLEYENVAKNINMNSVCLKFSVFDMNNRELCEPIYSEPIDNTKCAETCQLKIVHASRISGSSLGDDSILLFVEKVNKKNIKVRFFEIQKGVRVWEEFASFSELDVHHQYGIAFKTPPYKDKYPTQDVNVFFELFRPKDHAVSQKVPYCYKASMRHYKRRRTDDDYVEANTSNVVIPSIPVTVEDMNQVESNQMGSVVTPVQPLETFDYIPNTQINLESALPVIDDNLFNFNFCNMEEFSCIDPHEINQIINDLSSPVENSSYRQCLQIGNCLQVDSVKINKEKKLKENELKPFTELYKRYCKKSISVFNQFLDEIRQWPKFSPDNINMLCKLNEEKLSGNDNLIHLLVWMNYEKFLVKMLDILNKNFPDKRTLILDKVNDRGLSPLLMAVDCSQSKFVKILLNGGCNPNVRDIENGNTSCHFAVQNDDENCLMHLLRYNSLNLHYGYYADYNTYNDGGYTPLHLAVKKGSLPLLVCLINAGAPLDTRTTDGKNILHLAVEYGHLNITKHLVKHLKMDPNEETFIGSTALHIACVSNENQMKEIVTVLLENNADPLKNMKNNSSPWAYIVNNDKYELINIMKDYMPEDMIKCVDDDLSSLEDSLSQSSIEDENKQFSDDCVNEFMDFRTSELVAKSLDKTGKWKKIINVMKISAIMPICEMASSPSMIVLNDIEMEERYSLQEFHDILVNIDAAEAALIIRKKYRHLKFIQ